MKIKEHHHFFFVLLRILNVLGGNPGSVYHAHMAQRGLRSCRSQVLEHLEVFVEKCLVDEKRFRHLEVVPEPQEADYWCRVVKDTLLHVCDHSLFYAIHQFVLDLLPRFDDVAELPEADLGFFER